VYAEAVTEHYRHTQIGWTLIAIVVGVGLLELTIVALSTPSTLALTLAGALAAVFAVLLVMFASLTVVVDDRAVRLWFGSGLLRREVLLADVVAAGAVRDSAWAGWGVRAIPHGWSYRVGGLDAVELKLENGRVVRVGSDEPAVLLAAVKRELDRKEGP
jgi:hypothetical protein